MSKEDETMMKKSELSQTESKSESLDRSEDDREDRTEGSSRPISPLPFPVRLMRLLEREDPAKGIYWLKDGKEFAIHTENIQPTLVSDFQGAKWLSFTRTLNKWGFKRVQGAKQTLPPKTVAYHCDDFQRDNPHLVWNIANQSKPGNRKRKASSHHETTRPTEDEPGARRIPADSSTNEPGAAPVGFGSGRAGSISSAAPSPALETRASDLTSQLRGNMDGPLSSVARTYNFMQDLRNRSSNLNLHLTSQRALSQASMQADAILRRQLALSSGIGLNPTLQQHLVPNSAQQAARASMNAQLVQLSAQARNISQLDAAALALALEQQQVQEMVRARNQFNASRFRDPQDGNEERDRL